MEFVLALLDLGLLPDIVECRIINLQNKLLERYYVICLYSGEVIELKTWNQTAFGQATNVPSYRADWPKGCSMVIFTVCSDA